jgi:molybdenum cofactor cytidylyltransferase/nicotine blue oxidoreductase
VTIHGLLLAAGAGSRMGMPKALVHDEHGSWLVRGVRALHEGGCEEVTVVLGASAAEAAALVGELDVSVVVADDWAEGMSASLRAGLTGLGGSATAALVTLVDLPDVSSRVVARIIAGAADAAVLRRATYDGRPGHPVLLGRAQWAGIVAETSGDRGARDYLAARDVELVECGDLATGRDVDSRPTAD